ncbi:TPA: WcaF family extracellular polysaccharide biosynthesis acetyltransferase [Photobacterium damselae]
MNLSSYRSSYKVKYKILNIFWFLISIIFFETKIPYPSKFKTYILRFFLADIGHHVTIKPNVKIKYPWNLSIGSHSWIGEYVWIDNLAKVEIGNNCCLSQGVYLLTGNHNYKKDSFDLIIAGITINDGAWVGAKAIVGPGVTFGVRAILATGSVANKDLLEHSIYQGNPAELKRKRVIE